MFHNGRVIGDPGLEHGTVVDAVSGATLSNNRDDSLRVDTSGALLWRREDYVFVASSGLNSARRVLADLDEHVVVTSFRYGVAVNASKKRVLRFDIDPEPTAEPDRKASVAVCAALLHC